MPKCADPVICFTVHGKRLFRNFSFIKRHSLVLQNDHQVFSCGKCLNCRKKRSFELAVRCVLESSLYSNNCFLTLTYDESKKGYHNELDYSEIQKFKKRLRKHCKGKRIQIFNVHEYGRNGKKHWHLIVFNHDFPDKERWASSSKNPYYTSKALTRLWPFGHHIIGDVSEASALYQAQYTQKDFKYGNLTNGKRSNSKHSGIGKNYFLQHFKQILSLGYIPFAGKKVPIPRYYQKLAHKHWCHFHQPTAFLDGVERKKLYSRLKPGTENRELSDSWELFKSIKQDYLKELEKNWEQVISSYLTTNQNPSFILANDNALYDLQKTIQLNERF